MFASSLFRGLVVRDQLLTLACASIISIGGSSQASAQRPPLDPPIPVPCAENTTCAMPVYQDGTPGVVDPTKVAVLSYGSDELSAWPMIMVSGVKELNCDRPAGRQDGSAQHCITYNYKLPPIRGWTDCAGENEVCNSKGAGTDRYRVVKFGAGDQWAYVFANGYVDCKASSFNGIKINPAPNVAKRCYYSTLSFSPATGNSWKRCVAGGNNATINKCILPSARTYLVRLWKPGDPTFRTYFRTVTGSDFRCWSSFFKSDEVWLPSSKDVSSWNNNNTFMAGTQCDYLALGEVQAVYGNWELVGMCDGCGNNIEYAVTVGVEKGKSKEKSTGFALEVSQTVRAGNEATMFGSETSFTASYEQSQMIAESFTRTEGSEFKITCDKGALYQWVTTVRSFCAPNGLKLDPADCETIAKSKMFRCVPASQHPGRKPVDVAAAPPN